MNNFLYCRLLERYKAPCLNLEQLQKIHRGLGQQVSLVKYFVVKVIKCVVSFEVQDTTQFSNGYFFYKVVRFGRCTGLAWIAVNIVK